MACSVARVAGQGVRRETRFIIVVITITAVPLSHLTRRRRRRVRSCVTVPHSSSPLLPGKCPCSCLSDITSTSSTLLRSRVMSMKTMRLCTEFCSSSVTSHDGSHDQVGWPEVIGDGRESITYRNNKMRYEVANCSYDGPPRLSWLKIRFNCESGRDWRLVSRVMICCTSSSVMPGLDFSTSSKAFFSSSTESPWAIPRPCFSRKSPMIGMMMVSREVECAAVAPGGSDRIGSSSRPCDDW